MYSRGLRVEKGGLSVWISGLEMGLWFMGWKHKGNA